ncbi:hypothetical protein P8452_18601 [Trifolium repens]|nr:hypothetical protein P8452_18601 [Trifolium repens]
MDPSNPSHLGKMFMDFMNDGMDEELVRLYFEEVHAQEEIGSSTIVIATFSTGIDSKCFQLRKGDKPAEEDDVPYGYGFFHFVFATGAMYFAMLLLGWNSHHSMRKWSLDVGWTSAWVRIVNEWLAVCVYLWMLIAPIIWKNRHAEST